MTGARVTPRRYQLGLPPGVFSRQLHRQEPGYWLFKITLTYDRSNPLALNQAGNEIEPTGNNVFLIIQSKVVTSV